MKKFVLASSVLMLTAGVALAKEKKQPTAMTDAEMSRVVAGSTPALTGAGVATSYFAGSPAVFTATPAVPLDGTPSGVDPFAGTYTAPGFPR
jgi:hypothetical protein